MKVIIYDNKALYLDGYDTIERIENNIVSICYNEKRYVITGKELKIEYLNECEIMIKGIIEATTWI